MVDWICALSQILDRSPLLLSNTFNKKLHRSNSWQCHILACMLTCLAPRLRAEILDFRICSGHGELEEEACDSVQVASDEVCRALRHAEIFVQACQMEDAVSFIVATACTGEALTVHLHNLFWCVSGFLLATRVALGFSDDKLSAVIEQQVHCWSHIISRYISLGVELLDHKDLASTAQPIIESGLDCQLQESVFANMPSVAKLLSCRLRWLLSRDRTRENQVDSLLEDLKIDSKELLFKNGPGWDEENKERQPFARASWAGIPVSVKWCSLSYLKEHSSMLLRMRNPFILQLIGWTEAVDDKGLSCYMVMEDVLTDLEDFIMTKAESNAARDDDQVLLFPFSVALDMVLQIARGMWYLHRNGIAHRSLQSRKVLLCSRDVDGAGRLKLCHGGLPLFAQMSSASDFAADVLSFGMLCSEVLTGKKASTDMDGIVELQMPASTPVLLSDCLKACCDSKPQNRPEFGVICGLLRHLKLIVSNPRHLERLLYLNEAAKASSKPPLTDSASTLIKGTGKAVPDDMDIRAQLIDINVHLLHASTPPDIYPLVSMESWLGKPPISLSTLVNISSQLAENLQALHAQEVSSSTARSKFVIANAGTLKTSLVMDGCQGLLKSGWANTTLGVGTLEMWLQHISPKWKDIQKVALGVGLCLRHISKTPPKIGYYSQEMGSIDGFYPFHPSNILLNNQLKVAFLLDNSLSAWKGLIQWAGVHPQVGEGADNTLISIESYTTFYFGHLLSSILKVCLLKVDKSTTTSLDQHCEFVLTNLAMRCIQLRYLSMTEVVTILLSDNKPFRNY